MKAIRFHEHGGPEVLQVEEAPDPAPPGIGEVLLRVHATSLNHLDIWVRKGLPGIPLPHIPGCDAAGTIEGLGSNVPAHLSVGQRVLMNPGVSCGTCEFCAEGNGSLCLTYAIIGEHTDGAAAERVKVPARNIHPIPDSIPFEEAAAFGLVFLTAWRMVVTRARVQPGQDVLVHGAGSGVSHAAIQIAKLLGARVFATASSDAKLQKAKEQGADILINYRTADFEKVSRETTGKRGLDAIIDHVGTDTWVKNLRSLKRGGRLVTCGATSGFDPKEDLRHIFYRQLEILGSTMGSYKEFRDVFQLFVNGKFHPHVDRVYEMEEIAEAHRRMESRDFYGKLVVRIG